MTLVEVTSAQNVVARARLFTWQVLPVPVTVQVPAAVPPV
jgi:hypothetical protein